MVLDMLPLYRLLGVDAFPTSASVFPSLGILGLAQKDSPGDHGRHTAPSPTSHFSSSPSSSPTNTPVQIVSQVVIEQQLGSLGRRGQEGGEPPSDQTLHLLLLATLESVAMQAGARVTTQIGSTLHLLRELTTLFEDVILLWLQLHNQRSESLVCSSSSSEGELGSGGHAPTAERSGSYQGLVHVARTVLRLWLVLSSQVLCSSLTGQQAAEAKPLLFFPMVTISKACYSLQQVGVFRGNECLDHEFTLMILETFLSCLHSANLLALVVVCPVEDVFHVYRDTLSDGCQEWLTYLCSKLHAIVEADVIGLEASTWGQVMDYCYGLLTFVLKELIITAEHIKFFQKAAKSALSGEVLPRPITYSLQVATGFDKLTQRMSKLANILLDCFKQVSMIQLLSLQLLSETARDTVEIISNFLSNILDPSIRSNAEVLDHYLDLLESVWFRLSPNYAGSASWWKKLLNYFTLLREAEREMVHQVLYHLQCLFSHDSIMLKTKLTEHVILPLYIHLIAQVREKVYKNQTSSGSGSIQIRRASVDWNANLEDTLDDDEKALIVLFLKLLLKVVSHPSSVRSFLSTTSHLYSLFLLLPVPSFCPPTLAVAEECLKTLQKQPPGVTVEIDTSSTQKTLLKIFLKLGFSMPVDRITDLCLAVADGKISLPTFGIGEADRVHKRLQDTFEHPPLVQLLSPAFLNHMAIIANVWEILARLAPHGPLVLAILHENNVWDVVEGFLPILASLLSRIQQQIEGGALEADSGCVCLLQELCVSLLSHLMSMAHFLCWQKKVIKVCCMCVCGRPNL